MYCCNESRPSLDGDVVWCLDGEYCKCGCGGNAMLDGILGCVDSLGNDTDELDVRGTSGRSGKIVGSVVGVIGVVDVAG